MDSRLFSRAEILSEVHITHGNNPDYQDYLNDNELGVPFAVAWTRGGTENITDFAAMCIEESWQALCEMLVLSPEGQYGSLSEMEQLSRLPSTEGNGPTVASKHAGP